MIQVRRRRNPNAKDYIKREDLLKAVLEYQESIKNYEIEGKSAPNQPKIIGLYILQLCERIGTSHNFNRYTFKDLMIGDAIEQCCRAVTKFNHEKMLASATGNIFNYFTTVAWHAFQYRIIEERKQNAIKHKNYQNTFQANELEGVQIQNDSDNDYSNRIIEEFELKHIAKKKENKNDI